MLESACKTMKRYIESNLRLEKLVLHVYCSRELLRLVIQLITHASTSRITELDLSIKDYCYGSHRYHGYFPCQLAFNITSLTKLSVTSALLIRPLGRLNCSRLVSLTLRDIKGHASIRDILMSYPLIESLDLISVCKENEEDFRPDQKNDIVLCPSLISLSLADVPVECRLIRDILFGSPLVQKLYFQVGNFGTHIVLPYNLFTMRSLTELSVSHCEIQIDDGATTKFESRIFMFQRCYYRR